MDISLIAAGALCAIVVLYLAYALVHPERF